MSRVINPESAGKLRNQLTKSVVLATSELLKQKEPNETTKDLAAYIALALTEIYATIDPSVIAWEKRGYWVKADRFRLEWDWAQNQGEKLTKAVLVEDWGTVAGIAVFVIQKLSNVKPTSIKRGTPWTGAWKKLLENK